MKTQSLLTTIAVLLSLAAQAQVVNETVDFDTYLSAVDNDFTNRFDNGQGLNQITSNGITGGCLETPLTISWGNDNAIYCTRFKGVIGVNYISGICFKYDTLQLDNTNFDRPVSVWMKPSADPNHYLVASVLDTRQIQVISYSATGSSASMQLQHGHWYVLLLSANFTGGTLNDQINVNAQVNDLGVTGTDPPFPTGFTNVVLHDSVLIADTSIEVSITGTRWGGALYLDNFRFDGMKSYDYCLTTSVQGIHEDQPFRCIVENGILFLNDIEKFSGGRLEITGLSGQLVLQKEMEGSEMRADLSSLAEGLYLVTVSGGAKIVTRKIVLIR